MGSRTRPGDRPAPGSPAPRSPSHGLCFVEGGGNAAGRHPVSAALGGPERPVVAARCGGREAGAREALGRGGIPVFCLGARGTRRAGQQPRSGRAHKPRPPQALKAARARSRRFSQLRRGSPRFAPRQLRPPPPRAPASHSGESQAACGPAGLCHLHPSF